MKADLHHITYPGLDERITVLGYGDEVDTFVVHSRRFTVVVDTLSTPQACSAALERSALAYGEGQLLVVNTHADWDHVWGNAAVAGRAPIIAHSAAVTRLRDPVARQMLLGKARDEPRFREVRIVEPTLTFTGSLTIDGGDLTLELLHTPGHTPDHVIVWIPELRMCLAGDSAEDPLPELWDDTSESLQHMQASLQTMQALGAALILPSHGRAIDPGIAAHNLAYFDDLAARIELLLATGLPPDELTGSRGLRFEDLFGAHRPLSAGAEQFYRDCHAKAVLATTHRFLERDGQR